MATTTARKPAKDKADQPQAQEPQPEPEPTPDPEPAAPAKPEPKPTAPFNLGAGRITFYRPSLTLPDGTVVDCPHEQWGHEKEPHAMKCLRKLAAEHGVALAK
jgi:pyruvate/2-oxoglutarate dehydrogenase complex dihydrolipoamide acyltransferase (E2) component